MKHTIEHCLKLLIDTIGITGEPNFQILNSINSQCNKGTALTDRQYELVKQMLVEYSNKFKEHNIDILIVTETNQPLREIDRSKYIKLIDHLDLDKSTSTYKSKEKWQWIKIRFPFSKKNIIKVEAIGLAHKNDYYHKRGSHSHYFKLTEHTILNIIDVFVKQEFEIDNRLLEYAEQIKKIKTQESNIVPGLWNGKIKNISELGLQFVKSTVNDLDPIKLYDRKRILGLSNVQTNIPAGLVGKIINRDSTTMLVDPKSYSIDKIVEALYSLDRFPILVTIDQNEELDQMTKVYNGFKNIIPNSKSCALFRVDSSKDYNANDFIKERNLNNWLDSSTQIVYICKSKLPKLLLKTTWRPACVLSLSSYRANHQVAIYINDICDLIVYHDNQTSIFHRGVNHFGNV